jgi:redox-sensitive bicupin YhaK (pirin superfamily)
MNVITSTTMLSFRPWATASFFTVARAPRKIHCRSHLILCFLSSSSLSSSERTAIAIHGPVPAITTELSEGLDVRRVIPQNQNALFRSIGSFLFFDHLGPSSIPIDVAPHPHIGICTLTFLFSGSLLHRDSTGAERLIIPGEVNWMIAGKGITHSERPPTSIGTVHSELSSHAKKPLHGLQFWVALPKSEEEINPSFHFATSTVDISENENYEVEARLVIGSVVATQQKLIPISTDSGSVFLLDVSFNTKGSYWKAGSVLPWDNVPLEVGIYVVSGRIKVHETIATAHQASGIVHKH